MGTAIFQSCNTKEAVTPAVLQESEEIAKGTRSFSFTLMVVPASTSGSRTEALSNIQVSVVQGDKKVTQLTGETGTITFEDLKEGDVSWYINPGTASGLCMLSGVTELSVNSPTFNKDNQSNQKGNVSTLARLPRLNAGLTGNVKGNFDLNNSTFPTALEGITVRLQYAFAGNLQNSNGDLQIMEPNYFVTTTDANGNYTFTNVPSLDNVAGFGATVSASITTVNNGENIIFNSSIGVAPALLQSGKSNEAPNLVLEPSKINNVTVTGLFLGNFDFNNTTPYSGAAGAVIEINYAGKTYTTTTDASGRYTFVNLETFNNQVQVSGTFVASFNGKDIVYKASAFTTSVLASNSVVTTETMNAEPQNSIYATTITGKIEGNFDFNNGTADAGIAGVKVELNFKRYNTSLPNYSVLTDANGNFTFVDVPSNASADLISEIVLTRNGKPFTFENDEFISSSKIKAFDSFNFGTMKLNNNFANTTTITGKVIGDFDFNPVTPNAPLAGTKVSLMYSGSVFATTSTDANGVYVFTDVPGKEDFSNVSVKAEINVDRNGLPLKYSGTTPSISYTEFNPLETYTFENLIISAELSKTASITGVVFADLDYNPLTATTPVAGATVKVTNNADNTSVSLLTNASGAYSLSDLNINNQYTIDVTFEAVKNGLTIEYTGSRVITSGTLEELDIYEVPNITLEADLNNTASVTGLVFGDFNVLDKYKVNRDLLSTNSIFTYTDEDIYRALGFATNTMIESNIRVTGSLAADLGFVLGNGGEQLVTVTGLEVATIPGSSALIVNNTTIVGYITADGDTIRGNAMDFNVFTPNPEPTAKQTADNNIVVRLLLPNSTTLAYDRPTVSDFLKAGVTIKATLDETITGYDGPTEFFTTTNADGTFTFNNLPVQGDGNVDYKLESYFEVNFTRIDGVTEKILFNTLNETISVEGGKMKYISAEEVNFK